MSDMLEVTEEELAMAFSGPAHLADKIYVTTTPAGMRITFAEKRSEEAAPEFRSAVLLPFIVAKSLLELLERQMKNVKIISVPEEQEESDG